MRLELFAISGIPEVHPGDDVGAILAQAAQAAGDELRESDIVLIAQKIVSKSEGRFRVLSTIIPSPEALDLAKRCGKDARKVQAILDESSAILRVSNAAPDGIIIARHKCGWVSANAGIDESNLGSTEGQLLLLPIDPDASASRIAESIFRCTGQRPGVIVTDTFGRPWRKALVNVALGTSNVPPIISWVGKTDAYGRRLNVSEQALADELAAASGLLMFKNAGTPAVVVRGLQWDRATNASCRDYVRPVEQDLFT
ncbi:coenzyme F420-0:L-glutamate ligase [Bradyrhizobium vignae]|uniref:coenzyme F420-0:L-glutamate ligase n=1 Tax=Bradyrhizobium vignae TaxID=1549949 RepID=UPI00100B00F5|nr:coenzyme F420-0:L-glutamate ligase [Bradyrhizobium vignae]RXG97232.1 coenzyme F420-0:L-glutamate ligase [Bradyrhizobium vignae]